MATTTVTLETIQLATSLHAITLIVTLEADVARFDPIHLEFGAPAVRTFSTVPFNTTGMTAVFRVYDDRDPNTDPTLLFTQAATIHSPVDGGFYVPISAAQVPAPGIYYGEFEVQSSGVAVADGKWHGQVIVHGAGYSH